MNYKINQMFSIHLAIITLFVLTALTSTGFAQQDLSDLSNWETEGNWTQKENGVLTLKPGPNEEGWKRYGDYLWSKQKYGDFSLELEFKIPKEGNSGVFVRVKDKADPVDTGIEVQIDDAYGMEKVGRHNCGGVIGTVGPDKNMAKPAGEWNFMRVIARGSQLKVHLNGEQVVDVNLENTSRSDRPATGYIGLQDHGLRVWFRNVKIKELD